MMDSTPCNESKLCMVLCRKPSIYNSAFVSRLSATSHRDIWRQVYCFVFPVDFIARTSLTNNPLSSAAPIVVTPWGVGRGGRGPGSLKWDASPAPPAFPPEKGENQWFVGVAEWRFQPTASWRRRRRPQWDRVVGRRDAPMCHRVATIVFVPPSVCAPATPTLI